MPLTRFPRIVLPALAAGFLACSAADRGSTPTPPRGAGGAARSGILIADVTIVSPERAAPLAHADVLIREGRIAQIGSGLAATSTARRIDGRGKFLVPGLIDSHVHVDHQGPLDDDAIERHPDLLESWRAQLGRSYLAFGFTTLVDLDLRDASRAWFDAAPLHPRLHGCGRAVRIPGGYGAQRVPQDAAAAVAVNLVYEPAQHDRWPAGVEPGEFTPERAVERIAASGGICLKTFIEPGFGGAAHWPTPRPQTLHALRAEARRHGLVFVVHANAVEAWQAAIAAQADVIAHGLWHWPGDAMNARPPAQATEAIEAAARAGIAVQPTLQAVYGDESIFDPSILGEPRLEESLPRPVLAWLGGPEAQSARQALADEYRGAIGSLLGPKAPDPTRVMAVAPARAARTLRTMADRKVRLLLGTDTPSNQGIGNPPGLNGRLEMQRWFEAGVPLATILRAATLDNAAAFGLSRDIGSIELGKRADLLLLRDDPLRAIEAWDTIETVFLDGEPLARAALMPTD